MRAHSELAVDGSGIGATEITIDAEEFAELERRITQLVDVADTATADAEGLHAAVAADTFNAASADLRQLLAMARGELLLFGTLPEDVVSTLRELAEARDARRRELLSAYRSILF